MYGAEKRIAKPINQTEHFIHLLIKYAEETGP